MQSKQNTGEIICIMHNKVLTTVEGFIYLTAHGQSDQLLQGSLASVVSSCCDRLRDVC